MPDEEVPPPFPLPEVMVILAVDCSVTPFKVALTVIVTEPAAFPAKYSVLTPELEERVPKPLLKVQL